MIRTMADDLQWRECQHVRREQPQGPLAGTRAGIAA